MSGPSIVEYDDARHRARVVELWAGAFGYEDAHNAPELVIDKKLEVDDGLFFVAVDNGRVTGSIMAGYDGHRGWIYSLAVHPEHRRQGVGTALMETAQRKLTQLGCLKINLQIMAENERVRAFYEANGFSLEARVSMGKLL